MVPPSPLKVSPESVHLIEMEIAIMFSLTFHPNVVKLIGFTENYHYVLMKYYPVSLADILKNRDPSISDPLNSPSVNFKIMSDLASAYSSMQTLNISHRDIKPQNILIETLEVKEGQHSLLAVVCDFGLSRVHDGRSIVVPSLTVGLSPRYASPELVRSFLNNDDPDDKLMSDVLSDVYSFGMVLNHMLTKKVPYEDMSNVEDIFQAILEGGKFDRGEQPDDVLLSFMHQMATSCIEMKPVNRPSFVELYKKITSYSEENNLFLR
eukprot:Lithocolla_globosa_v1_NODE_3717_length_1594_cov_6.543394.p1 type:complete len:265 gc:universal NODE_3717_length_1594_cov_6.543394:1322-528(-)